MSNDFSAEYSERSDDGLLQLASDRDSLTAEAQVALDIELRRRNLTEHDRVRHQQFVKHNEQREAIRRRRRIFGIRSDWSAWVDLLWALLAMALISFAYLALPTRYHMKPDWQEASVPVMFASVLIAVSCSFGWRKIAFWMSLVISSAIHLVIVHAWIQRHGSLSRGYGKLAILLGFALFLAFYGFVWVLRRNFYGGQAQDDIADRSHPA